MFNKKRILSVLLVVAMLMTTLATSALATGATTSGNTGATTPGTGTTTPGTGTTTPGTGTTTPGTGTTTPGTGTTTPGGGGNTGGNVGGDTGSTGGSGGGGGGGSAAVETVKPDVEVKVNTADVNAAIKNNTPVQLPMDEVKVTEDAKDAPVIEITAPVNRPVKVEIPVANVTAGTVVVLVDANGKETIVPTTVMTENGLVIEIEGEVTVKVIDNATDFADVADNSTFAENIDFVSARGLFTGVTENTFVPNAAATRAQIMTVLARAAGVDTSVAPLATGMAWAKEQGISDGTNGNNAVTRQQLATMLWRYAGEPASTYALTAHGDNAAVADYAAIAMAWAVENGILTGYADGTLNPAATATRAHLAAMVARFIQLGL